MDFGAIVNGYCSDMTRTVAIGSVTDEHKLVYNTTLKAQLSAIENIKSGAVCGDIDKIARDIIYNAGYKGCFGHALGHSVGIDVHESPNLSPNNSAVLEVGNVVTVEPGIYIENKFGVRIEDMVYVTENGCINLTKTPKELIIL
jgi:Xaa-Pro aminopeptidase